jgi:glycosyltransferase involved in cell wall biosynthesis
MRDSKRMLLLVPALEPGGADRVNLDLATQLVTRHGYELHVIATLPGAQRWEQEYRARASAVIVMPRLVPPADQPAFLASYILSHRIGTVLIAHSEPAYRLLPFLRRHCPDVVISNYVHALEQYWRGGGYPRMALDQAAWLDQTITSSEDLRDWMVNGGADPDRITVCTTNIDPDEWNPAHYDRAAIRAALGIDAATPIVLYIARLVQQKRPRLLAELVERLTQRGERFVCLVVGDGPERGWLDDFVRRRRLESLRVLGPVGHERIRELLAAADLFVLPSRIEGIALVLYEALAMGLPVVAADVGGQRELVTPECGILVPRGPHEADAYTAALAALLADAPRRTAMGAAGRARIESHFRLDQMGDRMAELLAQTYARATAHPRRRPTADEARDSAASAVLLAREELDAYRLLATDAPSGAPAETLVRRARTVLRPAYRTLADRFPQLVPITLRLRAWLLQRIYRQEAP